MSRNFIAGCVAGAVLSVVTLGSLSLLASPNGPTEETVATTAIEPDPSGSGAPAPAGGESAAQPGSASPEQTAKTDAARPEAAIIEVPPGSEFAKPKEDAQSQVPEPEPEVAAESVPTEPAPGDEAEPGLTGTEAPTQPEVADAPQAPAAAAESEPVAPVAPAQDQIALAPEPSAALPPNQADQAPAPDTAPVAPVAEPVPEPSAAAEPPVPVESADQAQPEPESGGEEPEQQIVLDPGEDDAPGPIYDPEVEAQIPLDPPEAGADGQEEDGAAADGEGADGGEGGSGEPGGEAPDAEAPPEEKPALAISPGAKFVKVQPSQVTTPEPTELAASNQGGVKVNRPKVSDEPSVASGADAQLPETAPDSPIRQFAARFSNPDARPVLALVVMDRGIAEGGLDASALAAFPFPVTIAMDPLRTDASETAKLYRAAGAEVVLMASNLPQGATPADLEVAYQGYISAVPEAIGLLGGSTSEIQRSSLVAQHIAALLAADGRGMITFDQGLNPGRRAAEKLGVPTAAIERVFGQAEDNTGTLGRELDRAAFTTAQRGQLVIAIPSTPEAVTGFIAWASGPGAADLAIAPISAVMLGHQLVAPPAAAVEPVEPPSEPRPPAEVPETGGTGGADETSDY